MEDPRDDATELFLDVPGSRPLSFESRAESRCEWKHPPGFVLVLARLYPEPALAGKIDVLPLAGQQLGTDSPPGLKPMTLKKRMSNDYLQQETFKDGKVH